MRFFLLSITKITHGHILFALNAEDREDEYHGEYGEEHAGDSADGEVEPENLLGAVGEEREEAEDGGDYGEGDRVDLAGVGFDVEADVGRFGWSVSLFSHRGGPFDRLRDRCTEEGLVGGDEVDAGVDDYAAEHHEGGETALIEGEVR